MGGRRGVFLIHLIPEGKMRTQERMQSHVLPARTRRVWKPGGSEGRRRGLRQPIESLRFSGRMCSLEEKKEMKGVFPETRRGDKVSGGTGM